MDSQTVTSDRDRGAGYTAESRTGYSLQGISLRGDPEFEMGHLKSRREIGRGYPERYPVPDRFVSWRVPYPGYAPVEVNPVKARDTNTPELLATDRLTPEEFAEMRRKGSFRSFEGEIPVDSESGRPLNIRGRTGLSGRGALWSWGANFAADPIVVRRNEESGDFEMVAIKRASGEWALPGGFVNAGERVSRAVVREFSEEASGGKVALDYLNTCEGRLLYNGYVDDPRNTDNAWIETSVYLFSLPPRIGRSVHLEAGDDAQGVKWMPLTTEELSKPMYANHKDFVLLALAQLRAAASRGEL